MIDGANEKVLETMRDGLCYVDKDRIITFWNRAAEKISGFKAEEVIGRNCRDRVLSHIITKGNASCLTNSPVSDTVEDGLEREAEVYLHHKNGHRIPITVRTAPIFDAQGQVVGGIELFSDTSNTEATEQRVHELEEMALLDPLTSLANRSFVEKEILSRFEELKRYKLSFGLLFFNIDNFQECNSTYGEDIADALLKVVADTTSGALRPFDLVGRWGGEEFVVILKNLSEGDLFVVAERLRILVAGTFLDYENTDVKVTISVGGTLGTSEDTDKTILKRVKSLMTDAKKAGKDTVVIG